MGRGPTTMPSDQPSTTPSQAPTVSPTINPLDISNLDTIGATVQRPSPLLGTGTTLGNNIFRRSPLGVTIPFGDSPAVRPSPTSTTVTTTTTTTTTTSTSTTTTSNTRSSTDSNNTNMVQRARLPGYL